MKIDEQTTKARATIVPLAKKSAVYKQLYRPYRRVNGYADFKQVALDMAISSVTANIVGLHNLDQTLKEAAFCANFAASNSTPVYWLDENLAKAFLQTEIPKDLSLLKDPAILHSILLLPPVIKSPDAEQLTFVFMHYMAKNTVFEPVKVGNQFLHHANLDTNRLRWITILPSAQTYSSTSEVPDAASVNGLIHGNLEISDRVSLIDANTEVLSEQDFINAVDRLVVHTMLFLRYFNKFGEDTEEAHQYSSGLGFDKSTFKSKQVTLNPVWIGRGYKPRQRKATCSDEDQARKYQIHTKTFWRRGHYRHVKIGKKEDNSHKLVWVEPVFISR